MILASIAESLAQRQLRPLQVDERRNPYPGYYLFAPNSPDSIGFMDHSGEVVVKVETGTHANPRVDIDEKLTYFTVIAKASGMSPAFVIRDRNLVPVDTIFPVGQVAADFHEGRVWSDSSFLLLGARYTPMDLSQVTPGGNPKATVIEGVIQEIGFDGRLLFQWSSLDHIPVDQTCSDTDLSQQMVDYLHINSVERDADGHYLVSCRHTDEVIKINRFSGAVMWRLGGSASKGNEFRFLNDTINGFVGFSHQHSAVRSSRGTLLIYDNGNLKPAPIQSRVVEYEVDELAKTVRRVWSYTPASPMFSPTMGSIMELPSGSFVIGYGSGSGVGPGKSLIVGEEVNRTGRTDMRLSIIGTRSVAAYRFNKVQFGMTGIWRQITGPVKVSAATGDSTTNLEVDISGVTRPTSIVIEKHHYRPHRIDLSASGMCSIAPYRWILRAEDSAALSGTMSIVSEGLPFVDVSDGYFVYWRAEEGKGAFQREVDATYDAGSSRWNLSRLRNGEYALATASCIVPVPLSPTDSSTVEEARPTLVFRPANAASAYDVHVSLDPAFRTTLIQQRIADTALTIPVVLPRGVRCYWRVRRVRADRVGLWSQVSSFTIRAVSPVLVFPVSLADTVGVSVHDTLRWRRFSRATAYVVSVRDVELDSIVAQRTLADTAFELPPTIRYSRPYVWSVRAVTDTGTTAASESVFGTLPEIPWIVYPEPSTVHPSDQPLRHMHRPIAGADSSRIELLSQFLNGSVVATRGITSGRTALFEGLPIDEDLLVRVIGIGRYGTSVSSPRRIRIAPRATLQSFDLVQPLAFDKIRMGGQVTYEWQPVEGAREYHLQATTSAAFDRPDLDTVVSATQVIAKLPPQAPFLQWRVQARSAAGIGIWSDTVRIALQDDVPAELLPVEPPFGRLGAPVTGLFEIIRNDPEGTIMIEASSDPYFDSDVLTFAASQSKAVYAGLPAGRIVYWRAVRVMPNAEKLFGPWSLITTNQRTSVRDSVENVDLKFAFDRASQSLYCESCETAVEAISAFDILGRAVFVESIENGSRWSIATPLAEGPMMLFVAARVTGSPTPRFFVITI